MRTSPDFPGKNTRLDRPGKHGARSFENLVKMSNLADKRKYELSSLPPDHIIEMHVNRKEFNDLIVWGDHEILRIEIRGHIYLEPQSAKQLRQAIDHVIALIKQKYPRHYLVVFSDLAVGTNRLLTRAFMKMEASRLIAVLPFARDAYVRNFGSPDDDARNDLRNEFEYWQARDAMEIIEMPPSPTRQEAYLKAGYFIVEHSDLMIVAWTGTATPIAPLPPAWHPERRNWASPTSTSGPFPVRRDCAGQVRCQNFPGQPAGQWQRVFSPQ